MTNKQIWILPQRRHVVDAQRLTTALLDLVDNLSAEDRARFVAQGERVLKEVKKKPKESAA